MIFLPRNLCYFPTLLFTTFVAVLSTSKHNAKVDSLSDRSEHTSGRGCREIILIVLRLVQMSGNTCLCRRIWPQCLAGLEVLWNIYVRRGTRKAIRILTSTHICAKPYLQTILSKCILQVIFHLDVLHMSRTRVCKQNCWEFTSCTMLRWKYTKKQSWTEAVSMLQHR